MGILKIIEAKYYDHKNIDQGRNVTNVLLLMVDVDNGKLIYDGLYNHIFGDPAPRVQKILKIIFEYNNHRHTQIYEENEKIDLPYDFFRKNPRNNIFDSPQQSENSGQKSTAGTQIIHNETVFGDKVVSTGTKTKIKTEKKFTGNNENFLTKYFWPIIAITISLIGIIIEYLTYIK